MAKGWQLQSVTLNTDSGLLTIRPRPDDLCHLAFGIQRTEININMLPRLES